MDIMHIAIIISAVGALVLLAAWLSHNAGVQAGLQKAKTDAKAFGAAVETDVKAAARVMGAMPTSTVLGDLKQFVEHPLTSTEHLLAQHHFTTIKTSLAALGDDAHELGKIAAAEAEIAAQRAMIEFRAGLRAQAAALATPKPVVGAVALPPAAPTA